ncbi:MAG: hypothetical protein HZY73_11845 [Micropruina sp.]|nr:MAG: hypothetical protein HZY73_11845 [Micropruina sp.]
MTPSDRHGDFDRGFGRDGISGLVTPDRATRAREVSKPSAEDLAEARLAAQRLTLNQRRR